MTNQKFKIENKIYVEFNVEGKISDFRQLDR